MDISSASYIKDRNDDGTIIDGSDNIAIIATINGIAGYCVPLDNTNRHYKEIMAQVAAGDLTIAEAE